jgi:hypothetical protein
MIIASLTTIPGRLLNIFPMLESLVNQSEPFDEIYLNLARNSRKGIPYDLDEFNNRLANNQKLRDKIKVTVSDVDHGPIMKTLPLLSEYHDKDIWIISFDDDHLAHPDTLKILKPYILTYPDSAMSLSGFIVGDLPFVFEYVWNTKDVIHVDWILGVSLIIYRSDMIEYKDDHWINYWLSKKGVQRIVLPHKQSDLLTPITLNGQDGISNGKDFFEHNYTLANYMKSIGVYKEKSHNPFLSVGGVIILILLISALLIYIGIMVRTIFLPLMTIMILVYILIWLRLSNLFDLLGYLKYYLFVYPIMLLVVALMFTS